jgi:4-amino-4-deoxy-L-arabinose transferase-like glycosyltransferase
LTSSSLSTHLVSFSKERKNWLIAGCLGAVLLIGAFLRFYQLGQSGMNEYYAAAVKSMLLSWENFFFVAFEPGGSISLDKPPLGFWVEAVSAYFLGVNGFALALPNAIAGLLSIVLLYKLVRRPFGAAAGLVAALALAVTPVVVATERNNTIDGILVFVLLAAAWAFLQSVYTGKVRWLFLGAVFVGLGFNIKMLQAYMPLPAFYAVYFFGAKQPWTKKLVHLAAATVLLLVVSFSWAVAVDLTPAADRPYVDSTSGNRVLQLIFGHNGVERLTNSGGGGIGAPSGGPQQGTPPQLPSGQAFTAPTMNGGGPTGLFNGGQPGGPGGSMDFGTAGTLRLFTEPLVGEASWMLPFGLAGLIVLAIVLWRRQFGDLHVSVILWAGWLLPTIIYFTYSPGLMHSYYLIMLGAPLAALVALTAWALWQLAREHWIQGWSVGIVLAGGTLAFEAATLMGRTSLAIPAIIIAGMLFSLGVLLAFGGRLNAAMAPAALSCLIAAMLVAPMLWSGLMTFNLSASSLPAAGPSGGTATAMQAPRAQTGDGGLQAMLPQNSGGSLPGNPGAGGPGGGLNQSLLNYLLANTQPGTYLMATGRANSAAPYILATGRPVLALGGFLDQYDEVTAEQVSALVQSGQLRFVLSDSLDRHQDVAKWVKQNCAVVDSSAYSSGTSTSNDPGRFGSNVTLYDCGQ